MLSVCPEPWDPAHPRVPSRAKPTLVLNEGVGTWLCPRGSEPGDRGGSDLPARRLWPEVLTETVP